MAIWQCPFCGYAHDESEPDQDSGREGPFPFDDHPADWVCPDCGALKDDFEKVDKDG